MNQWQVQSAMDQALRAATSSKDGESVVVPWEEWSKLVWAINPPKFDKLFDRKK